MQIIDAQIPEMADIFNLNAIIALFATSYPSVENFTFYSYIST